MIRNLDYAINLSNGSFSKGMNAAMSQTSKLDNMFKNVGATVAAAFSMQQALGFTKEVTDIAAQFELIDNRIKAAGKGQREYIENNKFIKDTIKALKLPLQETTDGYSMYMAAIKGTSLEGKLGNKVFLNMSVGAKAASLTNEQLSRGFGALNKMISTGTVQADEFSGMLAEAIPGAMDMAQKAMGYNGIEAFRKDMELGKINAIDFVTKFSNLFKDQFKDKLPDALEGWISKLNEHNNAILESKRVLGIELMPVQVAWLGLQAKGLKLVQDGIAFYKEHKDVIDKVVTIVGHFAVGLAAVTVATKLWTGAQWLLNIALLANPIGLITIALAVVIGYVVAAYNKFETFRAVLDGVGSVLLALMKPLVAIGKIWAGIFTFDGNMIIDGIKDVGSAMKQLIGDGSMSGITDIYSKGYKDSLAKSKLGKKGEALPVGTGVPYEFSNIPILGDFFGAKKPPLLPIKPPPGTGPTSQSVSAGRSVRNINVQIKNLVETFKIETTNIQSSATDIKRMIQDALIRAVEDTEAAL